MNLPRLSDEELPEMPQPAIEGNAGTCCGNFTTGAEYMGQVETVCCGQPDEAWPDSYTAWQMQSAMRAAAEAQRLKDEQWMREQKPVARLLTCIAQNPHPLRKVIARTFDELAANHYPDHWEEGHLLFAAPVPASQGDEEVLREAERQIRHLVEDLTVLRVEGGVNHYEAVNNLVFSNCVAAMDRLLPRLAAALAAPVTTKEAEHG